MYKTITKPTLDRLCAVIALLLLSPLFLLVTLALTIANNNNSKPFFIQKRPGKLVYF
jgi:undecaprenyl phosphate N,N'-diacetylbacillosamine 1-phosphate transferase